MGGAENCVRLLVESLDRERFLPLVLCTQAGGPYEHELIQKGFAVKILNRHRRSILLFPVFCWDVFITLYEVFVFLKREKPDIVHTHLPASAYFGVIAGKLAGVSRLVYTFHSSTFFPLRPGRSFRTWLQVKLTRFLCRKVQVIVAVSRAIYEKLLTVVPELINSILVIPNGIDEARFQLVDAGLNLKHELGMAPEDPLITTVGTLSPVKNQAMLLKAFARLVSIYPKLRLIIVGEGPLRQELVELQQKLALKNNSFFLGLRKEIPEILAETDIFVSTSLYEGLPLSILEAMAAGKPVVATAVPGNLEVLEEGAGLLISLENQAELVKTLKMLIEDPAQRVVLGKRARERVAQHYSLEGNVLRWQALYEDLMRGRPLCLTR
jgi:glycosyltransferase involved in cell wall biosynthesis